MHATVYGVPGSHPTKAAVLMLEYKGIAAKRVDLPNVLCRAVVRAMGFAGPTVPAVKLDGRRVQTTIALARALDELRPDPPLFPSDPELRASVEAAERWGDEVLQGIARRISFSRPVRRRRDDLLTFFEGPLLGVPPKVLMKTAAPILATNARLCRADDEAVRADLAALPAALDYVDALIADGVIGTDQRNAADFQIAASVRLLLAYDDIVPAIEGRAAARHAREVVPYYPGHVPAALPEHWLAPLRSPAGEARASAP